MCGYYICMYVCMHTYIHTYIHIMCILCDFYFMNLLNLLNLSTYLKNTNQLLYGKLDEFLYSIVIHIFDLELYHRFQVLIIENTPCLLILRM